MFSKLQILKAPFDSQSQSSGYSPSGTRAHAILDIEVCSNVRVPCAYALLPYAYALQPPAKPLLAVNNERAVQHCGVITGTVARVRRLHVAAVVWGL